MGITIFVLVILAVVTIFSVQNAAPVAISFLFWKFEASLAIVIFLALLTGCAGMGVVALLLRTKASKKSRSTGAKPSPEKSRTT